MDFKYLPPKISNLFTQSRGRGGDILDVLAVIVKDKKHRPVSTQLAKKVADHLGEHRFLDILTFPEPVILSTPQCQRPEPDCPLSIHYVYAHSDALGRISSFDISGVRR